MTASLTRSLDARYYTDPTIFATEMEGLLSRTWQFAGHVSQVANVGDYFTFEIAGGQSLFCIRGRDGGVVRTFYNVCQHRRMRWSRAPATPAWWSAPPITPGATS